MAEKKKSSEFLKIMIYFLMIITAIIILAGIIFIYIGTKGFTEITYDNFRIASDVVGVILVIIGFWLLLKFIEIIKKVIDEGVIPEEIANVDSFSKLLRIKSK
jgi:cytochrome c biogenesis protein CcdA